MIAGMEVRVRERVDSVIYGVDNETLQSVVIGLLRERGLSIAVAEVNVGGLIAGWLDDADPQGQTFHGGWVLSKQHRWTRGQDSTLSKNMRQEGIRLAAEICTVIGADVGLAAINAGPESTYMVAVWEDILRDRTTRFRGYDFHSQNWVASMSLDLVRRICLNIAD